MSAMAQTEVAGLWGAFDLDWDSGLRPVLAPGSVYTVTRWVAFTGQQRCCLGLSGQLASMQKVING